MESSEIKFFDHTHDALKAKFEDLGEKGFRADQLYSWAYKKREESLDSMTDLSKSFRESMLEQISFERPPAVDFRQSFDGTQKYLFEVAPGLTVETVMIPAAHRRTLCVSSEVGCNLGCTFCYTGKYKLKKRLTPGQIVGQFLEVNDRLISAGDRPLTNIVFMGMGEPLDNPDGVFGAIEILQKDKGLNFARRRITVSTSGIVPLIPLVTKAKVRLAVSLNGSNDETRSKIMPINRKYPISVLLDACRKHINDSGDGVTFEYVMLKGVTDEMEHARELVQLLKGIEGHVNLIPFNEHPASDFKRPTEKRVSEFQEFLMSKGIRTYRRITRGLDIYAACGQLHSVSK